jgi:formamidopyrimidine-DNA glycosylase
MPELPEVETVRRGLAREILDRGIADVTVTGARSVRRHSPARLSTLVGDRFTAIDRYGKYLVARTANGADLVIHLRMSGQLRLHSRQDPLAPHTHVRIGLDDREVRFVDPRTFGELFLADESDASGRPTELAALGPDALDAPFDGPGLRRLFARRHTALKAVLLDQRAIAGIGNIYADEVCFDAGVRPGRPANAVSAVGAARIAVSIGTVLEAAVRAGGSTLRDARYRGVRGESGGFQDHHAVYARSGEPCVACGTPIRGIRIVGRSAHFCPKCQR